MLSLCTPYLLKCVTSEQTYTNIYFSQEGYSIWFEEFERDQLQRRYILMTEVIYQRYVILMIRERLLTKNI